MSEREARAAAEAWRGAHETQDLEALVERYAEDAVLIPTGVERSAARGKAAIRELVASWMLRPEPRRMEYTRLLVNGDEAAAEWRSTRIDPDGSEHHRWGSIFFQVKDGKIVYTRFYLA